MLNRWKISQIEEILVERSREQRTIYFQEQDIMNKELYTKILDYRL